MRVRQKMHMLVMAVPDSQIPPWQAYVRVHDRYKKMVRQDASGSRGRIMISASLLLPATEPKKHHREVCTQSKWYNIALEARAQQKNTINTQPFLSFIYDTTLHQRNEQLHLHLLHQSKIPSGVCVHGQNWRSFFVFGSRQKHRCLSCD